MFGAQSEQPQYVGVFQGEAGQQLLLAFKMETDRVLQDLQTAATAETHRVSNGIFGPRVEAAQLHQHPTYLTAFQRGLASIDQWQYNGVGKACATRLVQHHATVEVAYRAVVLQFVRDLFAHREAFNLAFEVPLWDRFVGEYFRLLRQQAVPDLLAYGSYTLIQKQALVMTLIRLGLTNLVGPQVKKYIERGPGMRRYTPRQPAAAAMPNPAPAVPAVPAPSRFRPPPSLPPLVHPSKTTRPKPLSSVRPVKPVKPVKSVKSAKPKPKRRSNRANSPISQNRQCSPNQPANKPMSSLVIDGLSEVTAQPVANKKPVSPKLGGFASDRRRSHRPVDSPKLGGFASDVPPSAQSTSISKMASAKSSRSGRKTSPPFRLYQSSAVGQRSSAKNPQ